MAENGADKMPRGDEGPSRARLPWSAPRLRRTDALEAQAKAHPGVESITRHLTS